MGEAQSGGKAAEGSDGESDGEGNPLQDLEDAVARDDLSRSASPLTHLSTASTTTPDASLPKSENTADKLSDFRSVMYDEDGRSRFVYEG